MKNITRPSLIVSLKAEVAYKAHWFFVKKIKRYWFDPMSKRQCLMVAFAAILAYPLAAYWGSTYLEQIKLCTTHNQAMLVATEHFLTCLAATLVFGWLSFDIYSMALKPVRMLAYRVMGDRNGG